MLERRTENPRVTGSNPVLGIPLFPGFGYGLQLWRYRPHLNSVTLYKFTLAASPAGYCCVQSFATNMIPFPLNI